MIESWRRFIAAYGFAPWVLFALAVLSFGPVALGIVLRSLQIPVGEFLGPVARGQIEWTAATLALMAGIFAYVRWRATSPTELEAVTLAFVLPGAALLDAFQALVPFMLEPGRAELAQSIAWNGSRWFMALSLTGGLAVAWSMSNKGPLQLPRLRWLAVVGVGVVGLLALSLGLDATGERDAFSRLLDRPWELGPLVFFVLAGVLWAGPIVRRRGNGFNRGLLLSFVPQVLCQIQMLAGSEVGGHWQKLLAYAVLLGGAVADYATSQRSGEDARIERDEVEEVLRSTTQELQLNEVRRREAEASLRMLAKAVETMSLGVTITDMAGRIVYVNPADARMHGYTVEELRGKDSAIYASRGDLEGGFYGVEPWARERVNRTKDGANFPVRLVSDRVRDEIGEPIATVTLCEDIRERIRIREALERRDRVLEAVAFASERFLTESTWDESVGDVLARLGQATGVDRLYLDLVEEDHPFGADVLYFWAVDPQEQAAAASRGAHQHPPQQVPERWEKELRSGQVVSGRLSEFPAAEGAPFEDRGVGSVALVPLFVDASWEGYLCLESSSTERDWSHAELEALRTASRTLGASVERRRDEEALAQSEAKYRDLLENAHDLIQSVSPDGRFQFVNRAWKQALGYSEDEISQLNVWQVVRTVNDGSGRDVLQNMMVNRGQGRVEAIFVGKDGREIAVEGVITRRYEDGLPVAAQGIFRDISERHAVDRMKQDFISTVSHELRTPLTSIIASLGLLVSGRLDSRPERQLQLTEVAHRNSNRLLRLINNLLDLQKLTARKMSFRNEPVEVASLLSETAVDIDAYAQQCGITIRVESVGEGLQVMADRDRLMQVLNNLIANAIKFSPAGESVSIGGHRSGLHVVLTVTDQGPGIPDEFRDRLFDQFTQADGSKTRASGGSGLGLSIAKGLVEGMAGHIDLETEAGRGTTFFVKLPVEVG
ncbi:MAG: PAS domain S-box protein [Acidobacteriota bacterium]